MGGCLDDAPALAWLSGVLSQRDGYKRRVSIGAGDANTGDFAVFDQDNTAYDELHHAAVGSGSIPGIFAPHVWRDMALMDGGTVYNVDVDSAVRQCKELVEDESQIIVDIAICLPKKEGAFATSKNAFTNYHRSKELHKKINNTNALNW